MKAVSVHTVSLANTALGMIRSLEYTVQNLEETAAKITGNIAEDRKRLDDLRDQIAQPFEYTDKLERLVKRQQEITDALDLAKN